MNPTTNSNHINYSDPPSYVAFPTTGSFYDKTTIQSSDTVTYSFQNDGAIARKEPAMFSIRTYKYIDGKFGADVLYEGRIVQTAHRTWKSEEKARLAAQRLIDAAVAQLFVFDE